MSESLGPPVSAREHRVSHPDNERLAVLENQYQAIQRDVSEIKGDVKALVAAQGQMILTLAVRDAATAKSETARASTGVWVRVLLPWMVAVAALAVGVVHTLLALTRP